MRFRGRGLSPPSALRVLGFCTRELSAIRVTDLFRLFFRVAFLMSPPQAVPAGERAFYVGVFSAVLTYVAALAVDFGVGYALARAVVDIALSGVLFWACLYMAGRQARFQQAFGAYCGAVAFANAAAFFLYAGGTAGEQTFSIADFVLLVWNLSLLGHVIRHSFELRMSLSIFAALVYVYVLTTVLFVVLPLPDLA